MGRITGNEIARLAGVSRSTVSRVVNNYPNVPPETRARVMEIIEAYNYHPQLSGQLLSGHGARTIGLFFCRNGNFVRDTCVSDMTQAVLEEAGKRGYLVLCDMVADAGDAEVQQRTLGFLMEGRIDAAIFLGVDCQAEIVQKIAAEGYYVGVFDAQPPKMENVFTANFDNLSGRMAVNYLYAMGHRKIALLNGDTSRFSGLERHREAEEALKELGLSLPEAWNIWGGYSIDEAYAAANRLLDAEERPTAVAAINDYGAFGLILACMERGIDIPGEISVVGADDLHDSRAVLPPLTTVQYPFGEMLGSLTNRILDALEGGGARILNNKTPGTFIERASVRRME